MKERPILFSAPMVSAILAGTKTQTRRVMQLHPSAIGCCCGGEAARWIAEGDRWHCGVCGGGARLTPTDVEYIRCPYGQPGDRLWVRETFQRFSEDGYTLYKADPKGLKEMNELKHDECLEARWRPSIHMPRSASRITLEIASVRVDRLQAISRADALAEGISQLHDQGFGLPAGEHYHAADPRQSFFSLWEAINGEGSVEANPWVWVVEFKRVEAAHG